MSFSLPRRMGSIVLIFRSDAVGTASRNFSTEMVRAVQSHRFISILKDIPPVKQTLAGYYVPCVEYDELGRKKSAYGTFLGVAKTGTYTSPGIRRWIAKVGAKGDNGGHIIPRCLNGFGGSTDNMFPQNTKINIRLGNCENHERTLIMQNSLKVTFWYKFNYTDPSHLDRPSSFTREIWWTCPNGKLVYYRKMTVQNPLVVDGNGPLKDEDIDSYIRPDFHFYRKPSRWMLSHPKPEQAAGKKIGPKKIVVPELVLPSNKLIVLKTTSKV